MTTNVMTILELRTAITQAIRSSSDPGAQAGAVLTIVTQQLLAEEKSIQASAPVAEVEGLRSAQARDVMPLIGPLLDSFELLANDLKTDPDLRELVRNLQAIEEAMLTAEPNEDRIEQAPAPRGEDEIVCEVVAHMRDVDGEPRLEWLGEGGPHDIPDGTPLFALQGSFDIEDGWASLYTRSNAKVGELDEMAWDALPERAIERRQFQATMKAFGWTSRTAVLDTLRRLWRDAPEGGSYRELLAITANEVAKLADQRREVAA